MKKNIEFSPPESFWYALLMVLVWLLGAFLFWGMVAIAYFCHIIIFNPLIWVH